MNIGGILKQNFNIFAIETTIHRAKFKSIFLIVLIFYKKIINCQNKNIPTKILRK